VDLAATEQVRNRLLAAGAMPRFVSQRIGPFTTQDGGERVADASFENMPGFLFDAVVFPGGDASVSVLAEDGQAIEFLKEQYRHNKPMLVMGSASKLLVKAGLLQAGAKGGAQIPGVLFATTSPLATTAEDFVHAIAQHRFPERETDPPLV
jgi:catalase